MGQCWVRPQCPRCGHSIVKVMKTGTIGKWIHYLRRMEETCGMHPGKTCDQILREMVTAR